MYGALVLLHLLIQPLVPFRFAAEPTRLCMGAWMLAVEAGLVFRRCPVLTAAVLAAYVTVHTVVD